MECWYDTAVNTAGKHYWLLLFSHYYYIFVVAVQSLSFARLFILLATEPQRGEVTMFCSSMLLYSEMYPEDYKHRMSLGLHLTASTCEQHSWNSGVLAQL